MGAQSGPTHAAEFFVIKTRRYFSSISQRPILSRGTIELISYKLMFLISYKHFEYKLIVIA